MSTTDPPRSGLRQVTADPLPQPFLPPSPRPPRALSPGLHFGMGLLSMRRSLPRRKAVRRLHRMGGAPRSRRSHVRRCLQPPGSRVGRLSAAIEGSGKSLGLWALSFACGRCRREGAASCQLPTVDPGWSAQPPTGSTASHRRRAAPRTPRQLREENDCGGLRQACSAYRGLEDHTVGRFTNFCVTAMRDTHAISGGHAPDAAQRTSSDWAQPTPSRNRADHLKNQNNLAGPRKRGRGPLQDASGGPSAPGGRYPPEAPAEGRPRSGETWGPGRNSYLVPSPHISPLRSE